MKELTEFIKELGFPIAISLWLLYMHFTILRQNIIVLTELRAVIKEVETTLIGMNIRLQRIEDKLKLEEGS